LDLQRSGDVHQNRQWGAFASSSSRRLFAYFAAAPGDFLGFTDRLVGGDLALHACARFGFPEENVGDGGDAAGGSRVVAIGDTARRAVGRA